MTCAHCGKPLIVVPPPPGTLTPAWGHAELPRDGHLPAVLPLVIIYTDHGGWWSADSGEVPGLPVRGARSLEEARSVTAELLRKITPPRPVIERTGSA